MLERQHAQLIAGLQELYRRMQNGDASTGSRLEVVNHDQPLTHEILEALGVLQPEKWEDTKRVDGTWQEFEKQGQDNNGWMYSETTSPSTQAAFTPTSPIIETAFPQSAIMLKRLSKYQISLPPLTQTSLSMPPPLMTNLASIKPEAYSHAFPNPIPINSDTFPSDEQIAMNDYRASGSTMDLFGLDDLFGNLGGQELSLKGCS